MADGVVATPRNWPRLWHEGNLAGLWSVAINLTTSLAMIGLLATGLWVWVRRQIRQKTRHRRQLASA